MQVGSNGNTSDLYLGGTWIESWLGYYILTKVYCGSSQFHQANVP
jgi:hypothetical protein